MSRARAFEPGEQVVKLFARFAILALAGVEAQAQLSAVVLQLLALPLQNLRQETKLDGLIALQVHDEPNDVEHQSLDLLLALRQLELRFAPILGRSKLACPPPVIIRLLDADRAKLPQDKLEGLLGDTPEPLADLCDGELERRRHPVQTDQRVHIHQSLEVALLIGLITEPIPGLAPDLLRDRLDERTEQLSKFLTVLLLKSSVRFLVGQHIEDRLRHQGILAIQSILAGFRI